VYLKRDFKAEGFTDRRNEGVYFITESG